MANKTICALTYGDTHVFTLPYGECSTAAATAAKVVAVQDGKFSLEKGARVCVKFTVTNTAAVGSLTLNVSGTGAKAIKYRGGNLGSAGYLAANRIYEFVYDGTDWELIGDINTNTTYSAATTSKAGLMSAEDKTKLDSISSNELSGLNKYWWRRCTLQKTNEVGPKTTIAVYMSNSSGYTNTYLTYSSDIVTDFNSLEITLATPTSKTASFYYSNPGALSAAYGKYTLYGNSAYLIGNNYTASSSDAYAYVVYLDAYKITPKILRGDWEYLSSDSSTTYPVGESGGYFYECLGLPYDNARHAPKIEEGYYIGTGTTGESNPCSLTFNFIPKVVFIFPVNYTNSKNGLLFMNGIARFDGFGTFYHSSGSQFSEHCVVSWNGNTVSWYSVEHTNSELAAIQHNVTNKKYLYLAIG